jgi:hypothetical protein
MSTQQFHAFTTQVKLDASSSAVVEHGVGKIPDAVFVQVAGPGQLASLKATDYTATTFKVKFNWHDGKDFAPGTVIKFAALVMYEADEEPPVDPPTPPVFTTSELKGNWAVPNDPNTHVMNEVWNAAEAGPQELRVWSKSHWEVTSNQPKAGVPKERWGAVKSYPCTQVLFPNVPVSSIASMTSRWDLTPPQGDFQWNTAYDIWFDNFSLELMIWPDHTYPASLPPSNATESTTVSIDGVLYTAWRHPNTKPNGWYIALVRQEKASAGEVNLLHVFQWLMLKGWIEPTRKLNAVDCGVEISHTNQTDQVFRMNDFDLRWSLV